MQMNENEVAQFNARVRSSVNNYSRLLFKKGSECERTLASLEQSIKEIRGRFQFFSWKGSDDIMLIVDSMHGNLNDLKDGLRDYKKFAESLATSLQGEENGK